MSEDEALHQPNDKLFKRAFSSLETAAGFLKAYLPETVVGLIDWSTLELKSGSFVDTKFRTHESDLLFSVSALGHEVYFFCLFEHQTREDRAMALRLLRYMVRIWEDVLAKTPTKSLPVILPVVLAQNDRPWKVPPYFSALFDLPDDCCPDLRSFVPDFLFRLIELAEIPFDSIRGTPLGIMVMRVMKAERSNNLLDKAVWDEDLMVQLPQAMLEALFEFMMNAEIDTAGLKSSISLIQTPNLQKTAMTLAQELRKEGRQEGRKQGRQEGRKQGRQEGRIQALQGILVKTLELRFDQIPIELRKEIEAITDEERLNYLHSAVIQGSSIEEFLKNL